MKISEKAVREYLLKDPEFFCKNSDLLHSIRIPVETGDAVSLIEYQQRNLKKQIQSLEEENDQMIETARVNSILFKKTKALVLAMLDTRDLQSLSVVLNEKLAKSFDLPMVRLLLADVKPELNLPSPLIQGILPERLKKGGDLENCMKADFRWVGRLNKKQMKSIFGENSESIRSSATLALVRGQKIGLLALGHSDQTFFQASMDTLFLDHIGEALTLILPRLIEGG